MAEVPFASKRANPRFSFFADAEITLKDGTSVPTQIAELSARGCYVGALVPIPIGTEFRLRMQELSEQKLFRYDVSFIKSS